MRCEICGERDAVIQIQQIKDSEIINLHLCEKCSENKTGFNCRSGLIGKNNERGAGGYVVKRVIRSAEDAFVHGDYGGGFGTPR